MFKTVLISFFISVFIYSCTKGQAKTEILIQLSEPDFVYSLCISPNDSLFLSVFNASKEKYNPGTDDFVEILVNNLMQKDANCQLASYFATFELKDKISTTTSNQEVIKVLKDEVHQAKLKTMQILKKRIETSYTGTSIFSKITSGIDVETKEIPEKKLYSITFNKTGNADHFKLLLQRKAELGFWETYKLEEIWKSLSSANDTLKSLMNTSKYEFLSKYANELDSFGRRDPLFRIINPSVIPNGGFRNNNEIGNSKISDTALVNKILAIPEVKNFLPRNLMILWDLKPLKSNNDVLYLYAIKITNRDAKPVMEGTNIEEATGEESKYHMPIISIKFNQEGTRIWARLTKENINRQLAMVINHKVLSSPTVMSEITGGNCEITGNFTIDEVKDLANLLNAGAMPKISVKVISINVH